jgi:poly-beta-1,6-N-acetyl-D-glucosamine synthase
MYNRLIVITPAYNEEKYIEKTIKCVIAQSLRPNRFIIYDDGSTDRTYEIALQYSKKFDFITVIRNNAKKLYDLNQASEAKAFLMALKTAKVKYDFIGKLDADLEFGSDYYKILLEKFSMNRKLGIAGGYCYDTTENGLKLEHTYKFHVRGAARVYRRECWEQIAGIIPKLGWDTVDIAKAQFLGWQTESFSELKIIHHVPTGSKNGYINGRIRKGKCEYMVGSDPIFLIIKLLWQSLANPSPINIFGNSICYISYIVSFLENIEKVGPPEIRKFIKNNQLRRLLLISEK